MYAYLISFKLPEIKQTSKDIKIYSSYFRIVMSRRWPTSYNIKYYSYI